MNDHQQSIEMFRHVAAIVSLLDRLLHDDGGQDLLEYAILTGLIAVGSILLFAQMTDGMEDSYNGWNSASQGAWDPCTLNSTCP